MKGKLVSTALVFAFSVAACDGAPLRDGELSGQWAIQYTVDSSTLPLPGSFSGELTLEKRAAEDSGYVGIAPDFQGSMALTPDSIEGYKGFPDSIGVNMRLPDHWWRTTYAWLWSGDSVVVRLNPHASHGGINMVGRWDEGRVVGRWDIQGYPPTRGGDVGRVTALATGVFTMKRLTP
jgi:hypothetical protein